MFPDLDLHCVIYIRFAPNTMYILMFLLTLKCLSLEAGWMVNLTSVTCHPIAFIYNYLYCQSTGVCIYCMSLCIYTFLKGLKSWDA